MYNNCRFLAKGYCQAAAFLMLEQETDPSQLFKDFVVHNSPFISPFRYFWRLAFEPLLPSSSHFSLACVAWPYFFYRSALSSTSTYQILLYRVVQKDPYQIAKASFKMFRMLRICRERRRTNFDCLSRAEPARKAAESELQNRPTAYPVREE